MWVMTGISLWLHNPSVMVGSYYPSQDRPGNAKITNNSKILSGLTRFISSLRDTSLSVCLGLCFKLAFLGTQANGEESTVMLPVVVALRNRGVDWAQAFKASICKWHTSLQLQCRWWKHGHTQLQGRYVKVQSCFTQQKRWVKSTNATTFTCLFHQP